MRPLGHDAVKVLARQLAEQQIDNLPMNLHAEHYTDVRVKVLNWEKVIQARQFALMTPTTHGNRQTRFNHIYTALQAFQQRLLNQGQPLTQ